MLFLCGILTPKHQITSLGDPERLKGLKKLVVSNFLWRAAVTVNVLLGTHNARGHPVIYVGGTGQTATLSDDIADQVSVLIQVAAEDIFHLPIQTKVFTGSGVAIVACSQVSGVLGRPARGTGAGGGYQDGGGLGGPAHGAGDVLVGVIGDIVVL